MTMWKKGIKNPAGSWARRGFNGLTAYILYVASGVRFTT